MKLTLSDSLITLIFPQECRICGNSVEIFGNGIACENCWLNTTIFNGSEALCEKCGEYLSSTRGKSKVICNRCSEHFFDCARAGGLYEGALGASVLELKEKNNIGKTFKNVIVNGFELSGFKNADILIPVPISKRRLLERGYNQSESIARLIARTFNLPISTNVLRRKKHEIKLRTGMDRRGRELSVKAAFEINNRRTIEGKKVIVIDDVVTSGATASACAKVIKKAGADAVFVYSAARTR
ncbi:MAG: ComF family protein [Pyrinomonadaceae bacterium]